MLGIVFLFWVNIGFSINHMLGLVFLFWVIQNDITTYFRGD